MADIETATAAGTIADTTGGGAPNDAPASASARMYSQEEFDTEKAKLKDRVVHEVIRKRDREVLAQLGVSSFDELSEKLRTAPAPKPTKSEAEILAEKITADFQPKLEAERKLRLAAEEALKAADARRDEEQLRAFLLAHVGDTTDPSLAMALFGMKYQPKREIRISNGKPTVFEDGTELAHIDPATYVKEQLAKPELGYFRKPTSVGTAPRTGNGNTPPVPPAVPPGPRRRLSEQEQMDAAVAAAMAHAASNSSGRQ